MGLGSVKSGGKAEPRFRAPNSDFLAHFEGFSTSIYIGIFDVQGSGAGCSEDIYALVRDGFRA